ncbi:hypothetical protein SFRURICE_019667 [Spodoptera frugiperda]|nr:hypothetical protein SFRURICE_019667 [Spodoptera frugiperda]
MCKIFNSKNLKAMEPGDGLPFTSFDQNELQQKEKGNGKEREKAKEKAQIGTRSKRDTKSVNPALTVKDEERVEKIKATNITGRRFPFAPLTMEGPITDEVKPNTSIIETKTPRFHHAIVPFFIDSRTYDAHLSEKILEAFDYFEKATCVRLQRLRERPTDQSSLQNVVWLYITNPSGIRQCVHSNEKAEIKGYRKFFEIEQTHTHLDNLPYDYASVLHYPARAFSRNGQSNIKIGQREGLSEMDVEKVGMLYSNECVKRNREYLVMTCPSVVRSQRAQPTPVSQEDIEEYFEYRLWPYGIINYQFKDKLEFSGEEIENINAVIRHIEKETCIEFRDLSDMQFSAETDSSEESAAAVEHGNDDNVNQETDLDDAGGKPEQSDTNDNKTEKEIPNSSEIKDVDKQTNKNTNNVDNDKNKHTIQNFLDTSSQDGVNPYDKLNDSDDDEKYKPVPYSKATDDEDKPYNALKRTDNAENGKISKGLNIRDGYRPRNNLNNNMRDQKKNSEPGKLSVGSKLKGIMLKEIKASNSSATSKYSLNLQQRRLRDVAASAHAIHDEESLGDSKLVELFYNNIQKNSKIRRRRGVPLSPARRHASFLIQFTRSPLPGCQCPHAGKPDGKYCQSHTQHILEAGSNHWIELHNPQVISTERHYIPRLVREAIEITKYKIFNREDGFQLSRAWNPVVQLCNTRKTAKKEESSRADTVVVINADCFNSLNDLLHLFVHILDVKEEMSVKLKPAASVGFPYDYQSVMHYPWLQIKDGKTNIMYPIWVTSIYCFTSTKNSVWESNALRGSPSASQSTCVQRREHANELLRKKKINK